MTFSTTLEQKPYSIFATSQKPVDDTPPSGSLYGTFSFDAQPTQHNKPASRVSFWRQWLVQWDISHFGIPLGFFGFTAMWQSAANYLFDTHSFALMLWYILFCLSSISLILCVFLYALRAALFPDGVVSDFRHARLRNFFCVPVLIGCLATLSAPPPLHTLATFRATFCTLLLYQLCLTLLHFGEWLTSIEVTSDIHPVSFLHTIGYFMLATIGCFAHLVDAAYAVFAVGMLLWIVVFTTNFQHLSTVLRDKNEAPAPTFFIFIGPPAQATFSALLLLTYDAVASSTDVVNTSALFQMPKELVWPRLADCFLFVDLFLYVLMVRLLPRLITCDFSVAWWAFIFPMSAAASASLWKFHSVGTQTWHAVGLVLFIAANAAMLCVFGLMLIALVRRKLPLSKSSLRQYELTLLATTVM